MLYKNFEVKDKEYKLVLTTRTLCTLEDKLGRNPMDILIEASENKMPKVRDMVLIFWASAQKYHHNIKLDDCFDIFDEWLEDGNSYMEFMGVIIDIFKVSGIFKEDDAEDEEKNA